MTERPVTAVSMKMIAKITSYEDGQLSGILDSIYFKEPFAFANMVEMINMMETTFDAMGFPDKTLLPRTFGKAKERMRRHEVDLEKLIRERQSAKAAAAGGAAGEAAGGGTTGGDADGNAGKSSDEPIAVFEIFVGFRLNAEWQGKLHWADKGVTKEFTSIVGLVRLLDEALQGR